ncbi:MAG: spore coat protein, partial [Desulfovibrionaceae bacterium]|nr:spore coat protein [Desulfovibrionaceae bacterium]
LPSEREHVGPYLINRPERFRIGGLEKFSGLAHHRWTLDEPADYALLSAVYDELYAAGEIFSTADIVALLSRRPEIAALNAHIVPNEGYLKSLAEDARGLASPEEGR